MIADDARSVQTPLKERYRATPDAADQIVLIRHHLQLEPENFQRGDYSDPAMIHDSDMPGLKEPKSGASQIEVTYAAIPAGAEMIFQTSDIRLLTATHRWSGAQLSEHGANTRAE